MQIERITGKTIDAHSWDAFVRQSPQGSLYSRHAYLCATHPPWEALIASDKGEWQAVFPLFPKQRYGLRLHWQPLLSQYTGILLKPLDKAQPLSYYEQQKTLIEALLNNLPSYRLFSGQFPPAFDYPLPFIWRGYTLTNRYTYQLDLAAMPAFRQLRTNLQRNIQKATKAGWTAAISRDTAAFTGLIEQSHPAILRSPEALQRASAVSDQLLTRCLGTLWACHDQDGRMRAGVLLGRDDTTTYYLMGAAEPEARRQGTLSLLLWQGIQHAAAFCSTFDFEGSMHPGIEHFFRGFGARPVPYLRVYRNQLPLRRLWAIFGY